MTNSALSSGSRSIRFPELDGYRGLGAILVMMGHTRAHELFWAVTLLDMFFVVSGFMIGRMVIMRVRHPRDMLAFFRRRIERLWPLYMVVILGIFFMDWMLSVMVPGSHFTAESLWRYLTFSQYSEYLFTGYPSFDYPKAAGHTWTLALEEQFYILLPSVVLLSLALGRPALLLILLIGLVAGVVWRTVGEGHYLTLGFHLDALVAGTLMAYFYPWMVENRARATTMLQLLVAIGLMGFCGYLWEGFSAYVDGSEAWPPPAGKHLAHWLFPIILLWVGLIGLVAVNPGTRAGRFWRQPWLVHLGLMSYALYMVHVPVLLVFEKLLMGGLDLAHTEWNRTWTRACGWPVALLAGHFLYVWLDRKLQQRGSGFARHQRSSVVAAETKAQ